MKVEITNSNIKDLLACLKAFPNGEVIAEDNKAYWVEKKEKEVIHASEINGFEKRLPQQPIQRQQKGDFFSNMRNSLFEAFSP